MKTLILLSLVGGEFGSVPNSNMSQAAHLEQNALLTILLMIPVRLRYVYVYVYVYVYAVCWNVIMMMNEIDVFDRLYICIYVILCFVIYVCMYVCMNECMHVCILSRVALTFEISHFAEYKLQILSYPLVYYLEMQAIQWRYISKT